MVDSVGIVGGGALGTLLADRLLGTGTRVRVVVRSESRRVALARDYPALAAGPDFDLLNECRLVLLCVKAYDTEEIARTLAGLQLRDTALCALQNGWGHMEILAASLSNAPLLAGAVSMGAYLDDNGSVHATGQGEILIAPWRSGDTAWAKRAADALHDAAIRTAIRPDARAVLWRKLVLNSAINPVTAIARCTNGALLRERALRHLAEQAAREAARVGWKLGLLEATFDPSRALRSILQETSENRSSMMEDLARRRRTEIEEINGAVVRLANQVGEPAPLQNAFLTLVRAAENRAED